MSLRSIADQTWYEEQSWLRMEGKNMPDVAMPQSLVDKIARRIDLETALKALDVEIAAETRELAKARGQAFMRLEHVRREAMEQING
jgi:hypothetical protein